MEQTYNTLEEIKGGRQADLFEEIVLREEQTEAIKKAKNRFCFENENGETEIRPVFRQFLWNAKMRFGKTLCALQLSREMGAKRTLIVTHRPVVNESWHEDFTKIFKDDSHYAYGTRFEEKASDFNVLQKLENFVKCKDNHYVFFVSMQYLRLSPLVNDKAKEKAKKNAQGTDLFGNNNQEEDKLKESILKNNWDLIVIDEAHEGTRTSLGKKVIDEYLTKATTKILHLSGTPFNLYEDFLDEEIYNWDYTKEQEAKLNWSKKHKGEPNPYAELPRMNFCRYDLAKNITKFIEEGGTFKFSEFFRTYTGNKKADGKSLPTPEHKGRFVHEEDVNNFLNLLCKKDATNNFPFSTDEYRKNFNHTLWVVPGVKEAKALKELLENHPKFKMFKVVNVAGENDEDEESDNALDKVKSAIGKMPEKTRTITISCGRLTTGVTVRPWTAVLYMKGSENSSAATYMQTIFRVQSPYTTSDGKHMKSECYVFDFIPMRQMKIIAETAKFASLTQKEKTIANMTEKQKDINNMVRFAMYSNFICLDEGAMEKLSPEKMAETLFSQLHEVYIDRVVKNGFNDNSLYNLSEIASASVEDIDDVNKLGEKLAKTTNLEKPKKVQKTSSDQMTPEQRAEMIRKREERKASLRKELEAAVQNGDTEKEREIKRKLGEISEEEKKERSEKRKKQEQFISVLRGISLRIPLIIFGAELKDETQGITIENFTSLVDDASWVEFMPRGVDKPTFDKYSKYYNTGIFTAAGKRIRALAKEADQMHVDERILRIAEIFSYFHNPDKETVLTRWPVVNRHMSGALGGYCFYNEDFTGKVQRDLLDEDGDVIDVVETIEPRFVDCGDITDKVFGDVDPNNGVNSKILEINSKTGLYPLYVVYSLYRSLLEVYALHPGLLDNPVDNLSISEEQSLWDEIVAKNMYVICNTSMAARITYRTLLGFRKDKNGNDLQTNIKADQLVEKATTDKEKLVNSIKSVGYWNGTKDKDMIEFSAVVGNPPYQVTSDVNNRQNPIYHYFYDLAESLSDIYTLISPARFLFNAGLTPSTWNEKMLSDNCLKVVYFTQDASTCFPNTDIKGGVVIMLRNTNDEGEPITKFLPDDNLRSIASKFNPQSENSLKNIVFGGRSDLKFNKKFLEVYPNTISDRLAFIQIKRPTVTVLGPNEEYELKSSTFDAIPYVFKDNVDDKSKFYHLLSLESSKRAWKYIEKAYMNPRYPDNNNISKFKVFVPKANGSGTLGETLSKSEIGFPNDSASSTFISIGAFGTEEEAVNCATYLKTKFLRCLLGILKITQDNPPSVWAYIPLQDFSSNSDINWSLSISEIDEQLYRKYNLDVFEIQFIEDNIKPMD